MSKDDEYVEYIATSGLYFVQNAQRASASNSFQFYSVRPALHCNHVPASMLEQHPPYTHTSSDDPGLLWCQTKRCGCDALGKCGGENGVCQKAGRMQWLQGLWAAEVTAACAQVNVGPTHIIFISSYIDYTVGSAQYNWLLNDLQSIDRSKTPW